PPRPTLFPYTTLFRSQKLSRGQKYVDGDSVRGARFKPHRKNVERGKQWDWNKNPFKNTRELNGLKTMIVLLNDWDVLKQNNKVIDRKSTRLNSSHLVI